MEAVEHDCSQALLAFLFNHQPTAIYYNENENANRSPTIRQLPRELFVNISLQVPSERLKHARASPDHVGDRDAHAALTQIGNEVKLRLVSTTTLSYNTRPQQTKTTTKRPKNFINYRIFHLQTVRDDRKLTNLMVYWSLDANIFFEVPTAQVM